MIYGYTYMYIYVGIYVYVYMETRSVASIFIIPHSIIPESEKRIEFFNQRKNIREREA